MLKLMIPWLLSMQADAKISKIKPRVKTTWAGLVPVLVHVTPNVQYMYLVNVNSLSLHFSFLWVIILYIIINSPLYTCAMRVIVVGLCLYVCLSVQFFSITMASVKVKH